MLFEPPRSFAPGGNGGVEVREKQPSESVSIGENLLGGIKSQLLAMQPESASDLTKESFEQLVALCMEENEAKTVEGDESEPKRPNISRALMIAHTLEVLSDCGKGDKNADSGRPSQMSTATAALSRLLSDVFLQSLAGYFAISEELSSEEAAVLPSIDKGVLDREKCGAILLAMQSTLPIQLLLADGTL